MAQELIYTSSASGLKPGSKGYCTVAATNGIAPRMVTLMESLSGYRHTVPPTRTPHPGNPVAFSHLHTPAGESLLSRVADAGLDYSGRSNKIAHHLLLASEERSRFGPAAMMRASDNLLTAWQSEPRWLGPRQLDGGVEAALPANNWQGVTGDAGWAGVLAQAAMDPARPDCFVIFESGQDVLGLFDESLRLLPPDQRWKVSFSTFFSRLPPGMSCQWRAVLQGSAEHQAVPPHNRVVRIDLTTKSNTEKSGPLVRLARSGEPATKAPVANTPTRPTHQPSLIHSPSLGAIGVASGVASEPGSEPIATPVAFNTQPGTPPPTSGEHFALPAFQDQPPLLQTSSEGQPTRPSSKSFLSILIVGLLVALLSAAGYFASRGIESVEEVPVASATPSTESDFGTALDWIDEPPIATDPIEMSSNLPNADGPETTQATDNIVPEDNTLNAKRSVPSTEIESTVSLEQENSSMDSIPEVDTRAEPKPLANPQPTPNQPSTPIRVQYLLEPNVWRQYSKQGQEWTGDQSVYRRSLDSKEPDRVAVVKLAANGKISKDDEFKYDLNSKALVFGQPSGGGLIPPTKVVLFEPASIVLQPNYAKRIADRFIIAQTGDDWSLLTIQGATTPQSGMDEPLRNRLSLKNKDTDSVTIQLGQINPELLRLASFRLNTAASKAWTATASAGKLQVERSFGDRRSINQRSIEEPPTFVSVDFSMKQQDVSTVRVNANLKPPVVRIKRKPKPDDDSGFAEVPDSVRIARRQLPKHPIKIDLVAELMLGENSYTAVVSQFVIEFE